MSFEAEQISNFSSEKNFKEKKKNTQNYIIPERKILKKENEVSEEEKKKYFLKVKNTFYREREDSEEKEFLTYTCPRLNEGTEKENKKILTKQEIVDFLLEKKDFDPRESFVTVRFLDRKGRLAEEKWMFLDYLRRIGVMEMADFFINTKKEEIKRVKQHYASERSKRMFLNEFSLFFLKKIAKEFLQKNNQKTEENLDEFFAFLQKKVIEFRLIKGKKIEQKFNRYYSKKKRLRSQYEEDPYFAALLEGGGYLFPQELSLHHDYLDAIDVLVEVDLEKFDEKGMIFLGVQRTLLKDKQRLAEKRNKIRKKPFIYLPEYPNRNPVFRFVFPEKIKDYYLKDVSVGDRKISRWEALKDILQEKGKKDDPSSAYRFVYQTFLGNDFSNEEEKDYNEEDENKDKRRGQDFETSLQGLKAMRQKKDLLDNAKLRVVNKSFTLLGVALLELENFKNKLEKEESKKDLARYRFYQLANYYQKVIKRMMYLIDKDQQKEQLREEGFSEEEIENLLEK